MPPTPVTRRPVPLSVELARLRTHGMTEQVGLQTDLPNLDLTLYDVILRENELIDPDAETGPGGLTVKEIFQQLPPEACMVKLRAANTFTPLPAGTPPPFPEPPAGKKYRKAEDVMGVLGDGFVIAAVPVASRYNRRLYTRYRDPEKGIPKVIEVPGEPGAKLVDLVKETDLSKVWFVYLTDEKPTAKRLLDPLPPGIPGPLEPPTDTEVGRYSADEVNDLLSAGGKVPKNFGAAPDGAEIKTGWERVQEPRKRLPRDETVVVNGEVWPIGKISERTSQNVRWFHREGTPWTLQTIPRRHWPPYRPPAESDQPTRGLLSKLNWRVTTMAVVVLFLIVIIGAIAWPDLAYAVIVAAILMGATYLVATRLPGPGSVLALAMGVGGCLAAFITLLTVLGRGDTFGKALLWAFVAWLFAAVIIGLVGAIGILASGDHTEALVGDPRASLITTGVAVIIGIIAAIMAISLTGSRLHPGGKPANWCDAFGAGTPQCPNGQAPPSISTTP